MSSKALRSNPHTYVPRRFFARLLLSLLGCSCLLSMAPPSRAAEDSSKDGKEILLEISLLHDPPKLTEGKFTFVVKYRKFLENREVAKILVTCDPALLCQSAGKFLKDNGSPQNEIGEFEVVLPASDAPDAMEIIVDLVVKSARGEKKIKTEAKIVDLGFRKHALVPVPDLQEPLSGNSTKEIFLEFRDGTEKITPVFPVTLDLSSDCLSFAIPAGDKPEAYGPSTRAEFETDADHSSRFTVQPHLWATGTCVIEVEETLKGTGKSKKIGPNPVNIPVKPSYLPAFLMALLGAFAQYFLGGCVRLIVAAEGTTLIAGAEEKAKVTPKAAGLQPPDPNAEKKKGYYAKLLFSAFVGPAGSLIASVFVTGAIAFLAAMFLKESNFLGVSIEKGNFWGFATLGFALGFTPVHKLWAEVARFFSSRGSSANEATAGEPKPAASV